jgi:anti-sigma factor RsiW
MDDIKPPSSSHASSNGAGGTPITEADLHGYVDQQLTPARRAEVEQHLSAHPDDRQRVQDWQQQNHLLRGMLNPVFDEPLPLRLPLRPPAVSYPWRGLAAGVAIAMASAGSAWVVRGAVDGEGARLGLAGSAGMLASTSSDLTGFARRAAVAHVVYSPDVRRPVEVGADQEQQLVYWLSKRLGTAVKPPSLQAIGYELIGGRLLPGDTGPVAQFMYHDAIGQRLTLYVTREVPKLADPRETAFRFGQDGPVNVFYWVDKTFGYAISGGAGRQELMRVSKEVHRQLTSA